MSSEPEDDFLALLKANGYDVEEPNGDDETVEVEYTGATLSFPDDNGYPVSIRVEFPIGQAMDAARALAIVGSAHYMPVFLAGALVEGDASVHGYMDANGIDTARYVEDAFAAHEDAPTLAEADEFFNLDK